MQNSLIPAALMLLFTTPGVAQTTRAEDPHVHGNGAVSIAVEGQNLTLLVESPAYDVLGFEYAATTVEDQRLVLAVRSLLETPRTLIGLSPEAGCTLDGVDVMIGPESVKHQNGHEDDVGQETHSDIVAEYNFRCIVPSNLNEIAFPWFEAFPLSQKLDVVVLDNRGQHAGTVTPDSSVFRIPKL